MKEFMKKFICIMLVAVMGVFLMSCGSKDSEPEEEPVEEPEITLDDIEEMQAAEDEDYDNGIYFEEETDGAEVVTQQKSGDDFVGSWEATSGQSKFQYGNVDLTINADGTWTGNITEEDFNGTWKESGDGIALTSDFFECSLAFTDKDVLVMQYDPQSESGQIITTVLSKKE